MMSLYRYFTSEVSFLPMPEATGIRKHATREANMAVKQAIQVRESQKGKKRKYNTSFTDQDRAKIGRFAAENSNTSALKKFRHDYLDLGESTVRIFRKKDY